MSCSSNEKLGSSRSVSLESSLNFQPTSSAELKSKNENNYYDEEDETTAATETVVTNNSEAQITDEIYANDEILEDKLLSKELEVKLGESESLNDVSKTLLTNEKLRINTITEAVGFLIFPSSGYINLAFKNLLIENCLFELFK